MNDAKPWRASSGRCPSHEYSPPPPVAEQSWPFVARAIGSPPESPLPLERFPNPGLKHKPNDDPRCRKCGAEVDVFETLCWCCDELRLDEEARLDAYDAEEQRGIDK